MHRHVADAVSIIHSQACLLTLDNLVQTHTVSNGNQVTVLNFMKDLLVNWTRSSRGKRFSESTKSLFATLSTRSMNAALLFSSIVGGPTRSTMKATIRQSRRFLEFGISPKSIEAVAEYYTEVMRAKSIPPGSLLVGTAVDDTVITGGADYDVATGHVIGHCGVDCPDDGPHTCTGAGWFIDRKDSDAFAKLVDAFSQHRVARCKLPICNTLIVALWYFLLSVCAICRLTSCHSCTTSSRRSSMCYICLSHLQQVHIQGIAGPETASACLVEAI